MKRVVPLLGALSFLLAGCVYALTSTPHGEGVAIYLTAQGLSVAQMEAADLVQVQPASTALIGPGDVLAYRQASHEVELAPDAKERVRNLKVPNNGVPFLVCVDRRPVYWGAFWTALSSASFEGVVIRLPLGSDGNTIQIELGYPGASFFQGQDPRGVPEIMRALERAGKLQ